MDAQTQAIEAACKAGIFREPEAKSMRILLRLVREQDKKLAKYECVVEAAKNWRSQKRLKPSFSEIGPIGMRDLIKIRVGSESDLINSIDALEEST